MWFYVRDLSYIHVVLCPSSRQILATPPDTRRKGQEEQYVRLFRSTCLQTQCEPLERQWTNGYRLIAGAPSLPGRPIHERVPGNRHDLLLFLFHLLSSTRLDIELGSSDTPISGCIMKSALDLYSGVEEYSDRMQSCWSASPTDWWHGPIVSVCVSHMHGGSVAESLACWTQAHNALGSNRYRDVVG